MVELKNISTLPLVNGRGERLYSKLSRKNAKVISKYNLSDYQKLKDFLERIQKMPKEEQSIICMDDDLVKLIKEVEEQLNYWAKPEIIEIPSNNNLLNRDVIDRNTIANELLYGSPFEYGKNHFYAVRNGLLSGYSVYDIKEMLTHTTVKGYNMLKTYLKIADDREIAKIVRALDLYDAQIDRQAFENGIIDGKDNPKLFTANLKEKEELIEPQIKDVADYICKSFYRPEVKSLVWGATPLFDLNKIQNAVNRELEQDLHDRWRLILNIAKYVSLDEAEQGLIRTGAADRFLVKK